jgi:hypothetical protein
MPTLINLPRWGMAGNIGIMAVIEPKSPQWTSNAGIIIRLLVFVPIFLGVRYCAVAASEWAAKTASDPEGVWQYILLGLLFILSCVSFAFAYGIAIIFPPRSTKWVVWIVGIALMVYDIVVNKSAWMLLAELFALFATTRELYQLQKEINSVDRIYDLIEEKRAERLQREEEEKLNEEG